MVKGDILDSICVAFHCLLKVARLVVPYLKEQPTGTRDTINEPFATGYEEPWYTLCVFTQASVHAKQDRGQCYSSSNFRFSKCVLIRIMLLLLKLQELVDYRVWESWQRQSCKFTQLQPTLIVASSEDDNTKLKPNTTNHRVRSRECRLIPSFQTKGEGWGCERKEKEAKKDRAQGTYM